MVVLESDATFLKNEMSKNMRKKYQRSKLPDFLCSCSLNASKHTSICKKINLEKITGNSFEELLNQVI